MLEEVDGKVDFCPMIGELLPIMNILDVSVIEIYQ